jgi:hypothetical protein
MGVFDSNCTRCGSREHATENCPHGFLSKKCSRCGSIDHATDDCPHGIFSSKCSRCGSREHTSSDCPHGIFSSKCSKCGSKEHSSSDCPHGVFSNKCGRCGSKNHATEKCPNGALGSLFKGTGSAGGDSGCGALIGILLVIALLLVVFSSPFKLLDPNFSGFSFAWLSNKDVWIFCTSAWLSAAFVIYLSHKAITKGKEKFEDRFSYPYFTLPLFILSISTFSTIFFAHRLGAYWIMISLVADLLYLGIVYLFVKGAAQNKKIALVSISAVIMVLSLWYTISYANKYSGLTNIDIEEVQKHRDYQDMLFKNASQIPDKMSLIEDLKSEYEKNFHADDHSDYNYLIARLYSKCTESDMLIYCSDTIKRKLTDSLLYRTYFDSAYSYLDKSLQLNPENKLSFYLLSILMYKDLYTCLNIKFNPEIPCCILANKSANHLLDMVENNAISFAESDTSANKERSKAVLESSILCLFVSADFARERKQQGTYDTIYYMIGERLKYLQKINDPKLDYCYQSGYLYNRVVNNKDEIKRCSKRIKRKLRIS